MFRKFIFFIVIIPFLLNAQHTIKGTFSPPEDFTWAILYKITPNTMMYVADTKIDKEGNFLFNLDSTAQKGVYKIVYAIPQEVYNFDVIYSGEEDIKLAFTMEEGAKFIASEENILLTSYNSEINNILISIFEEYKKPQLDKDAIMSLFEVQRTIQNTFEEASKGKVSSAFINASKHYIPTNFEDIQTYLTNRKSHYFKPVNFNSVTLQESSFLINRSYLFLTEFSSNNPETSKQNLQIVNKFIQETDSAFQKSLLYFLWLDLMNTEEEIIANYLAEDYLITLAEKEGDTTMVEQLTLSVTLANGAKAPNFLVKKEDNGGTAAQNLYDIDVSQNYILVFWSSGCSHCLVEIPKLQNVLKDIDPKKYKVIAVGLEDEPYAWKNKTYDFPEFIHVLGLGKWENEIGKKYGISSTPTYFVLNQDKKIISKPIDFENLIKFIEN
jgi:thiol-disulfide isomerase/thioredoxin